MSIIGLVVGLAALFLSALMWVEKRRSDRDQETTDELMMSYLLLVARGEGVGVEGGMMKRFVPGFGDESPMPVDVVNLVQIVADTERQGRAATVDEIRAAAPHGLGPIQPSPEAAIAEGISRRLVKKKGRALKLTREGRMLNKAMRYLESPLPKRMPEG